MQTNFIRKTVLAVLASSFILSTIPQYPAQAATGTKQVEVLLNARKMAFPDAKPFQDENSAVMVPIRFVSEKLGAKVGYERVDGKQNITLKTDKHSVTMTVGSSTATVDGTSKTYDSKIIVKQQRTYVPLRLVSEGLGQEVNWDQISRWVWIGSKKPPTVEELGLPKTSIDPYKSFFSNNPALMSNSYDQPYKYAVKIKTSNFPLLMAGYIYGIDLYTFHDDSAYNGLSYIRVRSSGNISPNLYLLTNKGDVRYRYKRNELTQKNNDGTVYSYYGVYANSDEIFEKIKDKKQLSIQDVKYIGFDSSFEQDDVSLILMDNPWRK
ncbi:copper amine oxidase N-terminal domain-containing protein [Paenibacillus wulumuqiensis]|uniref:copper amine oxidase N-terminal domain-containing protein n=1 Tax=Paenibacillus wulumuqiensis TaxID=1567107 RepID=UPI00061958DF|nr:copper amine oxidase N-terminal domain-containing protein [Paenibacillus wulumuqiensis]